MPDLEAERWRFEKWARRPPYELELDRFLPTDQFYAGQYMDYEVQLAWEAWCEALKGVSDAKAE